MQHLLAVCLICHTAALQRWGWRVKEKKKKKEDEEEAESGPGERKMWVLLEKQNVSNDARLMWWSVSAASYLHSEKLSGASLSGSRHGPRLSYFSLKKKTKNKRGTKKRKTLLAADERAESDSWSCTGIWRAHYRCVSMCPDEATWQHFAFFFFASLTLANTGGSLQSAPYY